MNETETRAHYIDPALREAGWGVVEGSRIRMEFPLTNGPLIGNGKRGRALKADYVLQYRNRNIGIVEAKADTLAYTEGVAQAKDYASRLQVRFTYSTNGKKIYQMDLLEGQEGDVAVYPSPDELWAMTFPSQSVPEPAEGINWNERLLSIPFEDRGGTWQPRYYQDNAITNVLEAMAKGKQRMLLTLATGTGKTAIAFQISWKLFQSRWSLKRDGARRPRILFLADRNLLADQAFRAFSNSFEDDALVRISPGEIRKKGKVPTNGSIFFTIFQTFMSGGSAPDEQDEEVMTKGTPYFGAYPEDFFDLIIIDECHRGGANDESSWRDIMEYFSPAVQLGLTATPRRDVNGDTYEYFGEPVYIYSLKAGINDGFLTPFRVKEIDTTIDEYKYTEGDMVLEGEVEYGKEYSEQDFNANIQIKAREEYRVKLLLDMMDQNHKTLVFCATQKHALLVRDLINQNSKSKSTDYCHRVTADDGALGEQHLKYFQDNERKIPTVLTTSQKLSTGVDAPEVRNIVLLRPVKSMVEFKQIVGRGTRLYDGKDYFTVFDFVEAHEHFNDPEWDGPPLPPPEPPTRPPLEPCKVCGKQPCVCEKVETPYCELCGKSPCECNGEPPKKMVKIQLSDGHVRDLDSMVKTSFWDAGGTPISAETFIKQLFGDLPFLFKNEDELRRIWSMPDTRKKLLAELEEKGYTEPQLRDLQKLVHGESSDLYDVLSYVAYTTALVPRTTRAERAKVHFDSYDAAQQEFLNFVLEQYIRSGFVELDDNKLPELLELKYSAIADAKAQLGSISSIRENFIGFQKWLYEEVA